MYKVIKNLGALTALARSWRAVDQSLGGMEAENRWSGADAQWCIPTWHECWGKILSYQVYVNEEGDTLSNGIFLMKDWKSVKKIFKA